jgi:hypothetical protein
MIIGTFILDFQTTDYPSDSIIAVDVLSQYQKACGLENQFALDAPVQSAGWFFAKLFLAGQLVEKIYAQNGTGIDASKGKKFEDKFIVWLGMQLKNKGCGAQVKMAPEMKSL